MNRERAAVLAVLAVTLLLRIGHLAGPTLRDEGVHGYMAQEILRGHLPFETVFDNKGVLLYSEQAAALAVFGMHSIAGIRLLGIAFVLGSMVALYLLLRDQYGHWEGILGAALFGFYSSLMQMQGHYYGSEVFTLLPTNLAAWCAWRGLVNEDRRLFFLSGLCLGLGIWTRLTVAPFVGSFGLFLLLYHRPSRLAGPFWMGLGLTLSCLPFIGLYLVAGRMDLLAQSYFLFSGAQLVTADVPGTPLEQLGRILAVAVPNMFILMVFLAGLPFSPWWRDRRTTFLALWLGGGLLCFLLTGQYLSKQLHQALPPLCGWAAVVLVDWIRQANWRRTVAWLLLAGSALWAAGLNFPRYYRLTVDDPSASEPIMVVGERVADWVREHSQPGDGLFVWGVEWQVYFRAERRSPSRHINLLAVILIAIAAERGAPVGDVLAQVQNEMSTQLKTHPPRYILVTSSVKNYDIEAYYLPAEFDAMLVRDYHLLFKDDPYWVFERNSSSR